MPTEPALPHVQEALLPVHSSLTRSKILLHALQSCQKIFQAEESAVLIPVPHAHELNMLCLCEAHAKRIRRIRIPRNHGVEWWLYTAGKPMYGPGALLRLPGSNAVASHPPHFLPEKVHNFMAVPLKNSARSKGTLVVVNPARGRHFEPSDLNHLRLLAQHLALALDNAQDYETLRSLNHELRRQVKATTTQLITANETLRQADVAKSDLISMVSHELRTPITAITGFAKLLLRAKTGSLTEEQSQFFQIIQKHSETLERMITDLLDITKMEQGRLDMHPGRHSLNTLVNEAVHSLQTLLPEHEKRIQIRPSEKSAPLRGDRMRLLQVINNFITNALKYSPPDTPITVTVTAPEDQICLSVENHGHLAPEQLEKVFEKFYRIKSSSVQNIPGSGLGLAISKQIILAQGGRIWAENRTPHLVAFCFCLPRYTEPAE